MALLERKCPHGHRWTDLVGVVAGPERLDCPACGARTVGNVPCSFVPDVCGIERLDAAEIQLGLENRAELERNADKLRSGEWGTRTSPPRAPGAATPDREDPPLNPWP